MRPVMAAPSTAASCSARTYTGRGTFMCFACMEEHPLAAYIFTGKIDFVTEKMMQRVQRESA